MSSSTAPHKFSDSYKRGQRGEDAARSFLVSCGFKTKCVTTKSDQRAGKDFIVDGSSLEVKTDDMALQTGNAYIETISNDRRGKAGWVHYTKADILFYIVGNQCYVCSPDALRSALPRWSKRFSTSRCENKTYASEGVLVPLRVLEREVVEFSFDITQYATDDMNYLRALVHAFALEREEYRIATNPSPILTWMAQRKLAQTR